jgi:uncharacterized coiled-coil protein SlyX
LQACACLIPEHAKCRRHSQRAVRKGACWHTSRRRGADVRYWIRTNDLRRRHATITGEVAASSESEVIAQQLSALGARITRLEARLAEVDIVIARLEGAALTTARSMQEISQHWDAVYEAMRRGEQPGDDSSRADARRSPPGEPHESSTDNAS